MKDINSCIDKIIKSNGATVLFSSPDTIAELKKQGLHLDQPAPKTPEEYIESTFREKKELAITNLNAIPSFPDVPNLTMRSLYNEIAECVLFGLNGAAISLSAILVEYALKYAIVTKIHGEKYDEKEWDRVEKMELGPSIQEAEKLGLIDEDFERQLNDFKNQIRNPYLHYNIKKLTRDVRANKVQKLDIVTGKLEEVQLDAEKNPFIWSHAKELVDSELVEKVVGFACYVVKNLIQ